MKQRTRFVIFAIGAICLLTVIALAIIPAILRPVAASDTEEGAPAQQNNGVQNPDQTDRELAATIRRLADRSTEGLVEQKTQDGGVQIDLQGRFQNVPLAKVNPDGKVAVGCVTSLAEANTFFGRNLENGEFHPPVVRQDDATTQAAQLGISRQEYIFYQNLIAEAARRRQLAPNAATITITNNDGAGEGFNDPAARAPEGGNTGVTLGAQRLNLFNFAAGIWGAFLDSNVTTNVTAQFNPLTPCSSSGGVLGSAGATSANRDFTNAEFTGTFYHVALANKQSGGDLNAATAEINTTFNSSVDNACLGAGTRFYYGLNNSTPPSTINLLVVLLHELGHGFGFSSFTNNTTGAFLGGFPDIYSRFMFDQSVSLYWNQMTAAQRVTSAVNTNNVLWDGASVRIGSGALIAGRDAATGRVQLFTPNPVQGGSSVSHWNTAASPNLLMEPSINSGLPIDLDLTRQQMRDIGWYRDTTADVVSDTITTVQPNSGVLAIGSTANITWTNTGGFSRNVTLELSIDGGVTFPTTIASNIANTGTQSFAVPNSPTTQAVVRVREHNFAAPSGVSSATFTISNVLTWNGSADSNWDNANNWNTLSAPLAANEVVIPASGVTNNPTISVSDVSVVNLTLGSGRIITVNSGRTLDISGCAPTAFTGGSATSYVIGSLQRCVSSGGTYNFPVGDGGYAPVALSNIVGTNQKFTIAANAAAPVASGLPPAVLNRTWNLTNGGITSGDVLFNYLDGDLPGGTTESTLAAYRIVTGAANNMSGTVNTGANTLSVPGVSAFSPWTLGGQNAPTLAKVSEFQGYRFNDGNLVRWQSSFETQNLGFQVYRQIGKERVRVTPEMVAGSALRFGAETVLNAGFSYTWFDAAGSSDSVYWVEDIALDGKTAMHGPIKLTPCENAQCVFAEQLRPQSSVLLNQIGAGGDTSWQKGAPAGGGVSGPQAANTPGTDAWRQQLRLAGQAAVKLRVRQDGWYRVSGAQLQAAGLPAAADAALLQLYVGGAQQAISARTASGGESGALGATGYIEFYATGADERETDARTYWLISGTERGLRLGAPARVAPDGGNGKGGASPTSSSFSYTIERKEKTIYVSSLLNGEAVDNFFGTVVGTAASNQTLAVTKLAPGATGATLEVSLQGFGLTSHRVDVKLNGQSLGEVTYVNQAIGMRRFNVPPGLLVETAGNVTNTVTMQGLGGNNDVSITNYLRLTYPHRYEAENDQLAFNGGRNVAVSGFTSGIVRVFDITEPGKSFELAARVSGGTVTIPGRLDGRALLAVGESRYLAPVEITANEASTWTNATRAADFLIITPREFRAAVEPLANARRGQGLATEVISVEDIYDEWSGGEKDVNSLRGFFAWARANWATPPRYALLVGDASFDPRNYLGLGNQDYIPTSYVATYQLETSSDEMLSDTNNDGIGELSMGRLPARTVMDVEVMVDKIVNYRPNQTANGAILVSDKLDGYNFTAMSQEVRQYIPANIPVTMINREGNPDADVRAQILASFQAGPMLINYFGHGSAEVWTGAGLLRSSDAPNLTNGNRLPVLFGMTCLNGYFHDLTSESLAEALVKARNGGAVATWMSSALTFAPGQQAMGRQLYQYIFQGGASPRLGDAITSAKNATFDLDVRRAWLLFGDPTMPMR